SPTKVYLKTAQHSIVIKNRNSAFILVDFKNKGWDASFVVDGDKTQEEINAEQKAQNNNFKSKIRKTPYDFGAKGGSNDDTQAVIDCINSGYFLINDIHNCQPITITGKSMDGVFTKPGK